MVVTQGTWGPQTGILGFINPFSRDAGLTEKLPSSYATPESRSTYVNPNQPSPAYNIYGQPNYSIDVLGAKDEKPPANDPNQPKPTVKKDSGNGGGGNNNSGGSWSDSENYGTWNGQVFRDANEWRKASGQTGYENQALGGGMDWNAEYAPEYQRLADYATFLGQAKTGDLSNVGSDYGMYKGQVTDEQKNLEAGLGEQQRQLYEGGRSAAGEALRSYNALAQQNMSRYGLGTGAGSFISDLLGQEYLRSQGNINEQTQSGTNELAIEGTKVKQYVSGKIGELDKWRRDAESKINDNFMAKMQDIESQKGMLDRDKAQQKRAAVQDAVNFKRQVENEDRTFKSQLAQFAIENMQKVSGQTFTPKEIAEVVNSFMNEGTLSTNGGQQTYSGQYDIQGKKKIDPNTGLPIA